MSVRQEKIFLSWLCVGTLLVMFGLPFRIVHAADFTDISRLRQVLMRNYDNHTRPVQSHKDATVVDVSFYYSGFELDEKRSLLTLHLLSAFNWNDEHIKWDPKDYRNLSEIQFASYELWKPDIAVFNNVEASEIDHFGNTQLVATHDSFISWVPPTKFQVGCELNLKFWPYDEQECYVQIGSWAHDGSQIALSVEVNHTKLTTEDTPFFNVSHNREWKITWSKIEFRILTFESIPEKTFHDIIISLKIQRKGTTHHAVVMMVAIGIAWTILLSFWISPLSNERIPIILVVMIINTLFLNYVYKTISSNGSDVPLVVGYYRDSLIMVTFDLLWTVILRYIAASKRSSPVPLPSLISSFLGSWAAVILCLNPRPKGKTDTSPASEDVADDEKDLMKIGNPYQEDWTWLAHLLDRVMFILYLIVYICFFIAFF